LACKVFQPKHTKGFSLSIPICSAHVFYNKVVDFCNKVFNSYSNLFKTFYQLLETLWHFLLHWHFRRCLHWEVLWHSIFEHYDCFSSKLQCERFLDHISVQDGFGQLPAWPAHFFSGNSEASYEFTWVNGQAAWFLTKPGLLA
jgi:hypothetical protein